MSRMGITRTGVRWVGICAWHRRLCGTRSLQARAHILRPVSATREQQFALINVGVGVLRLRRYAGGRGWVPRK